mgnify:CR=1 FL=1
MADYSEWDSQVFGYRIGTHRYIDLPRSIGATKNLDVVFARGPYRGQLPDPRSTVFEVQVDLRYDARSQASEAEAALPLASNTNLPDVLRIAEATLTGHRWGRDPKLAPRASNFYRKWLTTAHEREQVHVIPGHGCRGFIVIERSAGEHRLSLIAIDPAFQHRGYGKHLVKFFLSQRATAHRVKTWIDNVAALNLYCQSGFLVESVECVEHVWLQ